jgi:mono/diheme cytochrome c family protein
MTKLIICALALAAVLPALASPSAKAKVDLSKLPPVAQVKNVTYSGHIQKIFESSCVNCHGPERSKGKLRLDSLTAALKGGESGKVVVPGRSAESLLVQAVAHLGDDEDHFMPPPGNKAGIERLKPEQISLIRAWIDQGAK